MKKVSYIFICANVLLSLLSAPVFAQDTATTTAQLQQLIQSLQQQITTLKAQIETLNQARSQVQETTRGIETTLRLIRQLRPGMSGDDVKLLQETLATDPEIYPEGLITGYFGKLTEKAVKKFQQKANLDQVGAVGPKTLSKINELLAEGAGASGKVPPGLLIAPGIRKKLGFIPQPLAGQKLPPGIAKKIGQATSTPDTTPPVMSELVATSTTATSTRITWLTNEKADGKVWYSTSTPVFISTSTAMISHSDLLLTHDLILSGLTAGTTYYYLVSSTDESGNQATSTEKFFTTLSQ